MPAELVETAVIPFPGVSGRGVKIAVIDSGVNAAHPHIVAATKTVLIGSPEEFRATDDMVGHGTAVTAAIQEKAPDAEYYAVKLFDASLRTSTPRLIQAIEWALDNRMDVVNLSLGTPNLDYRAELQALVNRANAQGITLVSARHAAGKPALPGALNGVVSVDVDWDLSRERYRIAGSIDAPYYFASGFPRSLPGMSPARNLNGISFAVANMTGFVARACEALPKRSFDCVAEALAAEIDRLKKHES